MPSLSVHSQISQPVSRFSLPVEEGLTGLISFEVSCLNDAGFEKAYAMTGTGIAVDVVTDMLSSRDCSPKYLEPRANSLSCQYSDKHAVASKNEDNSKTGHRCLSMSKLLHDCCCLHSVFRSRR